MIVAIVLAAGHSRRFGSPKVLALLHGVPLVRHVVERVCASQVERVIVVAGSEADDTGRAMAGLPAQLAVNPDPDGGLASSIHAGLLAAPPNASAIVIVLGDQPTVDAAVIDALIADWKRGFGDIMVPWYAGERGHPVLFDAKLRAELLLLEGDTGARDLIERNAGRVHRVHLETSSPPDVDTPEDLLALE